MMTLPFNKYGLEEWPQVCTMKNIREGRHSREEFFTLSKQFYGIKESDAAAFYEFAVGLSKAAFKRLLKEAKARKVFAAKIDTLRGQAA
jgi:hypothetical protein